MKKVNMREKKLGRNVGKEREKFLASNPEPPNLIYFSSIYKCLSILRLSRVMFSSLSGAK
jgi:hypothetical protein